LFFLPTPTTPLYSRNVSQAPASLRPENRQINCTLPQRCSECKWQCHEQRQPELQQQDAKTAFSVDAGSLKTSSFHVLEAGGGRQHQRIHQRSANAGNGTASAIAAAAQTATTTTQEAEATEDTEASVWKPSQPESFLQLRPKCYLGLLP